MNRTERRVFWLEFGILVAAGVLATVAVLPYSLTLTGQDLTRVSLSIPLWLLLVLQISQNGVLIALLVGTGLWAARRVGLAAPALEGWLRGEAGAWGWLRPMVVPALAIGVIGSLLVIGLDAWAFMPGLPALAKAGTVYQPPAWQGLLASFYGGITEELLMRLGLMSLLAWLVGLVWKGRNSHPAVGAMWLVIVLVAVLFSLGHLPATAALVTITPLVVLRAIVLNGLLAVGFGWLYWQRGLEAAMMAHFTADIVLHVILPLMGQA